MSRIRWLASGGIFIMLTLIKLAVPGAAVQMREYVECYVNCDTDYSSALTHLDSIRNKLLSPEKTEPVFPEKTGASASAEAGDIILLRQECIPTPSVEDFSALYNADLIPDEAYFDEAAADTAQAERSSEAPDCVQTFLESQTEFAELALPANVSYDYMPLPFDFAPPVSGVISDGFGYRMHPILGEIKFHYGTDSAANAGECIYAFSDGTVSFAGENDSYGKHIIISHPDGWQTLYAHCSELYVSAGDEVSRGGLIALVGSTGLATGPHLHFELTHNGSYFNPEYYVNSV